MTSLTSRERFKRMFEHKEADRVPIIDSPWQDTIERWHREGMPEGMDFVDYFDLDRVEGIVVNNSPMYEAVTLEETEEYRIYTTNWGTTLKNFKHRTSTPEFLDFKIKTPDDWLKAKERMVPSYDRVPWDFLKANYSKWREKGYWLEARLWFGFDVTHSWTVGTENLLIALAENPDWCYDMFNHFLDVNLAVMDMVLDAGYEFDSAFWWDDMGYKQNQFFSLKTYREILKPVQKRAIEWAHSRGMKTHLHSCGDIRPFVPELIEIGLDALNPLEVKAGMDPLELKAKYGKDLVLHGGLNAILFEDVEKLKEEMKKLIPIMKENGGFIISSDHSVPSSVSLQEFREVTELAKELGSYR